MLEPDQLYTSAAVARYLGVAKNTIMRAVKSGSLEVTAYVFEDVTSDPDVKKYPLFNLVDIKAYDRVRNRKHDPGTPRPHRKRSY